MQRSNYAFRNELESIMRVDSGSPDCDSVEFFGDKNRDSPSFCSSVSACGSMNEARLRGGQYHPGPTAQEVFERRRRNLSWNEEEEARDNFARGKCQVSVYDEHGRRMGGPLSPAQPPAPAPPYNVYHTWRGPPLHPMPPVYHQPTYLCVEDPGARPISHRRSFSHVLVPHPPPRPPHMPLNVSVPYSPMLSISTPSLSFKGPFGAGPMSPRIPLPVIKKDFDVWAYDQAHDSRMSEKYGNYVDV